MIESNKKNATFSLSVEALNRLEELRNKTGNSKGGVIENALQVYEESLKDDSVIDKVEKANRIKEALKEGTKIMFNLVSKEL